MSKPSIDTVFVFGAGASVDCGLPAMKQFGAQVSRLAAADSKSDDIAADLKEIDSLLQNRPTAHLDWFDPRNMEHVFALLEMRAEMGDWEARNSLKRLTRVIAYVFDICCLREAGVFVGFKRVPQSVGYVRLLRGLKQVYEKKWPSGEPPFAFVSLNYDLALESAWYSELQHGHLSDIKDAYYDWFYEDSTIHLDDEGMREVRGVDESRGLKPWLRFARYGLLGSGRECTVYPLMLKLHGSLNWGVCDSCGRIEEVDARFMAGSDLLSSVEGQHCTLHAEAQHNPANVPPELHYRTLLIPPNLGKTGQCETIRVLWGRAVRVLAEARHVVFVGYSLPDTDMHIRYLLAAALQDRKRSPRVMVINKHCCDDEEQASKRRYQQATGAGFSDSCGDRYINKSFADAIKDIEGFIQPGGE